MLASGEKASNIVQEKLLTSGGTAIIRSSREAPAQFP